MISKKIVFIGLFISVMIYLVFAITGANIVSEVTSFVVNNKPYITDLSVDPSEGNASTEFGCICSINDNDSDSYTFDHFWRINNNYPFVLDFETNFSFLSFMPDLSNRFNGTFINGNKPKHYSGKIGELSAFFAGTESCIGFPADSFFIDRPLTIEFWLRHADAGTIAAVYDDTTKIYKIYIDESSLDLIVETVYKEKTHSYEVIEIPGDWVLVDILFLTDNINIYVDGVLKLNETLYYDDSSKTNFTIGCYDASDPKDYFNYYLDEFRVYPYALPLEQILKHNGTVYKFLEAGFYGGDNISCYCRSSDSYEYSNLNRSSIITVQNSPPIKPVLVAPTNNNNSLINRNVNFYWNASDVDQDTLTFDLVINNSVAPNHEYNEITATKSGNTYNYTIPDELWTEFETNYHNYTWKVRAYDGTNYSEWSDTFSFSIQDYVAINSVNNSLDFGTLNPLQTYDTDSDLNPFVFRNVGNVNVDLKNVTLNPVTDTFWLSKPLGTEYLQIKADNYSSNTSVNESGSQFTWINFSQGNEYLVRSLDYHSNKSFVELDLKLIVPGQEPASNRSKEFMFYWIASDN